MSRDQADLFAEDEHERNRLPDSRRQMIRARLEMTLAKLEAATGFAWRDPLDAVHEENRFEREAALLGEEGAALWARFDREMDRLYELQAAAEAPSDISRSVEGG